MKISLQNFKKCTQLLVRAILVLLVLLSTMPSSQAQNSMVGDGFGGNAGYTPVNYTVGSYSGYTTCNGVLKGWGANQYWQLGNGNTYGNGTITPVDILSNVKYYSTGYIMGAIKNDNTLWAWGRAPYSIPGGTSYMVAGATPTQYATDVKFVDAGAVHLAYVKNDGTAWVLGNDGVYQTATSSATPHQVTGINNCVRVAAGGYSLYAYTVFLLSDGTVKYIAGDTTGGFSVLSPTSTPTLIPSLTNVVDIKANNYVFYALKSDGTVWGMGTPSLNVGDGLGDGTRNPSPSVPVKALIPPGVSIKAISACNDGYTLLALSTTGDVYAWGGIVGSAGTGMTTPALTPVLVASNVKDIMAGESFSYIYKNDGTLWATGAGSSGYGSIWMNRTNITRYTFTQVDPGVSPMNLCAIQPAGTSCLAGVTVPALSDTTKENICPAITVDLSGITVSNTPVGTTLTWHSATPISAANQLSNVTALPAGSYYASFYDATNNCYGPAKKVIATVETRCLDSDGDGIKDFKDLDNDNDGILDDIEKGCIFPAYSSVTLSTSLLNYSPLSDLLTGNNPVTFEYDNAVGATILELSFPLPTKLTDINISGLDLILTDNNNVTGLGQYVVQGWNGTSYVSISDTLFSSQAIDISSNIAYYTKYRIRGVSGGISLDYGGLSQLTYVGNTGCTEFDTDNDGIVNRLDLDSDGDGCPDAIEGAGTFKSSNLFTSTMPGGNSGTSYTGTVSFPVTQNLGNTVDANGVPTIATASGQGIGTSQDKTQQDAFCCSTIAPILSATTKSNTCPATTVDLSTITASNTPANAILTWHSGTPATTANKLNSVTALTAGTYYASFYTASNDCYGPTSEVTLVVNNCVSIVANPNTATTTANSAVSIPVLANDTNSGVPATLTNVGLPTVSTNPAHGTTSINADGSITYTPTSGYVGTDTFIYTLCDKTQTSVCDTALVTISVGCPVLSIPTGAVASAASICIGGSSTLSANACSGGTLTWYSDMALTSVLSSTSVSPSATTTYYAACVSGTCKSPASLVTVTVNSLPSAPVPTSLTKNNVCPSTTATLISLQPAAVAGITYEWHTAAINPVAGTLVSNASSVGAGTYYLYAKSSTGCYSVASSAVTVTINACILANPNVVNTLQNTAVSIPVLGNDTRNGVAATLTNVSLPTVSTNPAHGSTSVNADGSITYTPTSGYLGTDTFIYTLCDKTQTSVCDTALVTVTVAQEVIYTFTNVCPSTTVDLTNHTPLTIPAGVTATFHSGTPATVANKLTNLSVGAGKYYMAFEDNKGTLTTTDDCYSPTASLNIVINECVEANYDVATTLLNTAVSIPVLANDSNSGAAATLTNVGLPTVSTNPAHGSTSVNTDGSISYTPTAGYVGTDSFIYTLCAKNQTSACDTALVMVSIGCPVLSSPTGAVASASNICTGGSSTLSAACSSGILTWYSDATLTSVLSSTLVTPTTTTTYYGACVNSVCQSPASSVTVTVTATPLAPTDASASPSAICSGSSSVLSATCATGTLSWYTDSGLTGTALASSTVSPTTTTTYYGACVNGICKSPASSVTVTVTATPLAPTGASASPSAICSGSSSMLSATCATGTLSWYTDSGLTGTALASSTVSPTTTTTYYGACVNG
ncbi:Ig-like domain-containing protein, partial [Cellulophaga sp. BC115SP]|uniref:Ig-like domain-containing protein n=1 Tax=Cellulophaga sp. BC115SP TaxID=2683263 RepID=UPI001412DC13